MLKKHDNGITPLYENNSSRDQSLVRIPVSNADCQRTPCILTLNWLAPKVTTQGLMPPVPKAMRVIPIKEMGLETVVVILS